VKAELKIHSDLSLIPTVFTLFRLMMLISYNHGGLLDNFTDRLQYSSTAPLSHHDHYAFANFYLTDTPIWHESTSLNIHHVCSCLLAPIFFFRWGSLNLPVVIFTMLSLGPPFERFLNWRAE
jgi:hypothetical protein